MKKNEIIEKIDDLIKQATEERSHYYVKSVLLETKDYILRQKEEFKRIVKKETNKWKGDGLIGRRGDHAQWFKDEILKTLDNLK